MCLILFLFQADSLPFNRGALLNAGFELAMSEDGDLSWDCLVLHDVDLLPMREDNVYTCGDQVS